MVDSICRPCGSVVPFLVLNKYVMCLHMISIYLQEALREIIRRITTLSKDNVEVRLYSTTPGEALIEIGFTCSAINFESSRIKDVARE